MIEIKSSAEFNEKLKGFRGISKKLLSNCFLMPHEIERLASDGKLFLAEYPEWLFVIADREDYKNLYYYTTELSDPAYVKSLTADINCKDLYLDVVTRSGRGDTLTAAKLLDCGFAESYKAYQRMQLSTKEIIPGSLSINLPDGYRLSTDYCNTEELHALWKCCLDEKSTPLPKEKELDDFRKKGNLITVLDNNDRLCAVLVIDVSSRSALIQHVSVSPLHRRKGLALCIMNKALELSLKENLNLVTLWVDCNNSSAIALYDRLGFKADGMLCDQLYMKGN